MSDKIKVQFSNGTSKVYEGRGVQVEGDYFVIVGGADSARLLRSEVTTLSILKRSTIEASKVSEDYEPLNS